MLPDWFNNWVGPIMLTVFLGIAVVMVIALCMQMWKEFKPKKGDNDKCR